MVVENFPSNVMNCAARVQNFWRHYHSLLGPGGPVAGALSPFVFPSVWPNSAPDAHAGLHCQPAILTGKPGWLELQATGTSCPIYDDNRDFVPIDQDY